MIDLQTETIIPIREAPRHFPVRVSLGSVYRWIDRGARGVVLESVLIGGRRMTSAQAIQRFIDNTTDAGSQNRQSATPVRSRPRQRKIQAAERAVKDLLEPQEAK